MAFDDSGLDRRRLLRAFTVLGGLGLSGCAGGLTVADAGRLSPYDRARTLAPLRARPERIFDIGVCLRPLRAAGPRLDVEQVGDTMVVHNYGHGGSGWSLSWGSSTIAVRKAMESSPDRIAVVGCGALGLTSALLAQSAGAQVTIYARELITESASMGATGSWTPDSRIALADAVDPGFPALWEEMARTSLKRFRGYLGLPGEPVKWIDRYVVSDAPPPGAPAQPPGPREGELEFAVLAGRIRDVTPRAETLDPRDTPFRAGLVRRQTNMMFNLASYANTLITDYRLAGGRIERREFHEPDELTGLPEKVVINCSGYGARALWRDETIVPVRGQVAYLVPQPEFDYGLLYRGVNVVPRSDGIVVQAVSGGDMRGYGEDSLAPDREESVAAVETLAGLYADFRRRGQGKDR
jgi:glycine/D-amino acid oxidase-like deaminating enzyme